MKDFKLTMFSILTCLIILRCIEPEKDILGMAGAECKIWSIHDKSISDRPTHLFICFNKNKYNCVSLYKSGKLKTPKRFNDPFWGGSDVLYPLIEFGRWEIKHDSLILQGKGFSSIKRIADTIILRPDAYLLDQTNKFNIDNCDCDSLVAQFKGGAIDSIKTVLNYKN
jgi:hypothetical protein